jgi:transcriptional regulator with PAS, ATPase and Fis domain
MEIFSNTIQFYESVLDSTVDGVVVVDKDYKVLYINKTVENWVGFNGLALKEKMRLESTAERLLLRWIATRYVRLD